MSSDLSRKYGEAISYLETNFGAPAATITAYVTRLRREAAEARITIRDQRERIAYLEGKVDAHEGGFDD